MASLEFVTLGVADPAAAERFYSAAFDEDKLVRLQASEEPTTGFRGYTMSLIVARPADAEGLIAATLDAGAPTLKAAEKSLWATAAWPRPPAALCGRGVLVEEGHRSGHDGAAVVPASTSGVAQPRGGRRAT